MDNVTVQYLKFLKGTFFWHPVDDSKLEMIRRVTSTLCSKVLSTKKGIYCSPIATFVRGPIATIVTSPGNCFVILDIASQASSSGKIIFCVFKPFCVLLYLWFCSCQASLRRRHRWTHPIRGRTLCGHKQQRVPLLHPWEKFVLNPNHETPITIFAIFAGAPSPKSYM